MSATKKRHLHLISIATYDIVHIAEQDPFLFLPLLHRDGFSETDLLTCDVVQVKAAAYCTIRNFLKYFKEFS